MALVMSFAPMPPASKLPFGPGFLVLMPFLYAVVGFLFVALACAIYNLAARFVGGLEISVVEVPDA
jgi:asparagine N-glycosylation enzyme membrane subunit Stt3